MTGLLNGDFETWSNGTTFNNPVNGTQLADNWFYSQNNGGGGAFQILRNTSPHTGTYDLQAFQISTTGAGTQEVYQDISNYIDYADTVTTFSLWAFGNPGNPGNFYLKIDDGITSTINTFTNPGATYAQYSVIHTVSSSNTQLRVSILIDSNVVFPINVDDSSLISIPVFLPKTASMNLIF